MIHSRTVLNVKFLALVLAMFLALLAAMLNQSNFVSRIGALLCEEESFPCDPANEVFLAPASLTVASSTLSASPMSMA